MTGAPVGAHALELLEGALAYASASLRTVTDDDLRRPTPCSAWDLDRLLTHMDDALDAFTEGAHGAVGVRALGSGQRAARDLSPRVESMRVKACGLVAAWRSARVPSRATVGGPATTVADPSVSTELLALAAALEITVHGWDVGRATGRGARIPPRLAAGLLPTAHHLIATADRPLLFARPIPVEDAAPPDVRLLAWCGRVAG